MTSYGLPMQSTATFLLHLNGSEKSAILPASFTGKVNYLYMREQDYSASTTKKQSTMVWNLQKRSYSYRHADRCRRNYPENDAQTGCDRQIFGTQLSIRQPASKNDNRNKTLRDTTQRRSISECISESYPTHQYGWRPTGGHESRGGTTTGASGGRRRNHQVTG